MTSIRSMVFSAAVAAVAGVVGCTSVLGDYTVSPGGSDASLDGPGSADGSSTDTSAGGDATPDATGGDDGSAEGGDSSSGDSGSGCGANMIACNNGCVPVDVHHCGTCSLDCTNLPHVSGGTTCTGTHCAYPASACAPGFANCDGNNDNGCEADLSQPAHCGSCNTTCSGGTPVCSGGGDG